MTFELPINISSNHVSECWTFCKSCILDTYLGGQQWQALNMSVYLDMSGNAFWGKNGTFYKLEYFDEILAISSGNLRRISVNKVVDFIKDNLNKDTYIIIDCNMSKISLDSEAGLQIHEILIYGYDEDEKVFFSPLLDNRTGKYVVVKIPYEKLKVSFSDARKRYLNDPKYRYLRRYHYFYPITKIRPKTISINKFEFLISMIRKIENETRSERTIIENVSEIGVALQQRAVYTGMGSFVLLKCKLEEYFSNPEEKFIDITQPLLKFYEHKSNILVGITIAFELFGVCNGAEELRELYANLVKQIQKAYLLAYKYSNTNNLKDIRSVYELICENIREEPELLKRISNAFVCKLEDYYRGN